ncbi:DUF421 domain-containing protein [Paracoccus sphaerophysae]|uniref:DUF421 domain-containing protein n=1 Tax=Paracoccus sphaerophysae TaxID=690417 RepID=UPI00235637B1|nr:YetF domain-containing protein [Paracoccus sphaerophysae]
MDDPVTPFDLGRMFFGDHPPLFYAEIAFRTVVIYAYTLALIRWIGGRSVAQLSMVDLLLVIALGSAVGDATFYADVPLLQAMLVITLIVGLNKLLDTLIERSDRAKRIIDGRTIEVARNGRILCDGLRRRDLSPLEIKSMLRVAGVANLGQVESAYLEAGGGLSVFRRAAPVQGLPLVPPMDVTPLPPLDGGGDAACCSNCGAVQDPAQVRADTVCDQCGRCQWTPARLAPPDAPGQH